MKLLKGIHENIFCQLSVEFEMDPTLELPYKCSKNCLNEFSVKFREEYRIFKRNLEGSNQRMFLDFKTTLWKNFYWKFRMISHRNFQKSYWRIFQKNSQRNVHESSQKKKLRADFYKKFPQELLLKFLEEL